MKKITTVGLDLAKSVFQVHGIAEEGVVIVRRALRRSQVLDFFRTLQPCLVGMEACGSAHYWAREIQALGHTVRMMPAAYVKAYVKRNKTDAADAEAICEAVTRPTMRYVPAKTQDEQAAGMVLKARDLLIRQRTQTINALRAHLAELGIVRATGLVGIISLAAIVRDDSDLRLPGEARMALEELVEQIETVTARIERLDRKILEAVRKDDSARRLTAIPGVGPIIAATIRAVVPDPAGFRTGRDFAAWIGLTPRAHSSGGKERIVSISKRKPATANATCRWSDVDPQARSSWPPGITRDSGHDVAPPVQGCRCRTRKQDRAHYRRSSRSWRYLSGSEDDRPGLDIRAFRPTSRRERQGANCDDPTGRHPEANQTEKSQAHESARS